MEDTLRNISNLFHWARLLYLWHWVYSTTWQNIVPISWNLLIIANRSVRFPITTCLKSKDTKLRTYNNKLVIYSNIDCRTSFVEDIIRKSNTQYTCHNFVQSKKQKKKYAKFECRRYMKKTQNIQFNFFDIAVHLLDSTVIYTE